MFLRKIKVTTRIVIGFAAMLVLMALIGANGILNFNQMGGEIDVLTKVSDTNYFTMFSRMDQARYEVTGNEAEVQAVLAHLQEAQKLAREAEAIVESEKMKSKMRIIQQQLKQLEINFTDFSALEQDKLVQKTAWLDASLEAETATAHLVEIQGNIIKDQKDIADAGKSFDIYRITIEATQQFDQARMLVNDYLTSNSEETLGSINALLDTSLNLYNEQKGMYFIAYSDVVIKEIGDYKVALNQYALLQSDQVKKSGVMNESGKQISVIAKSAQEEVKSNVQALKAQSFLTILGLTIVAIIIGGLGTLFISNSIRLPLKRYVAKINEFSEGDLTVQFDATGKDELTEMGKALSHMNEKLKEAIGKIIVNAEGFQVASQEVINTTDAFNVEIANELEVTLKLSAETEESMENVSIAVEEVAKGALSSAEYATESANAAEKTRHISQMSAKAMDEVVAEINHVSENAKNIESKMSAVSQEVEKISVITERITEIAVQTNLLALNATIEAARAGEHGKGFGVVAAEVRKLSEESDLLAKEIEGMIVGLIEHTKVASNEIQASERIVMSVTEKSLETKDDLYQALDEIHKLSLSMQSIAAVTQEQASSSEEIMATTESVLDATTSVVTSVHKINDIKNQSVEVTSKELKDIQDKAGELVSILSYFKL